jgi:hypothetical protein
MADTTVEQLREYIGSVKRESTDVPLGVLKALEMLAEAIDALDKKYAMHQHEALHRPMYWDGDED